MTANFIPNPACPTSGCTKLNDPGRLAALHATGLLGSPPEDAFDRFTRLASSLLDTPLTAISLVERERVFIKSQVGLGEPAASERYAPVDETFCKYIVDTTDPLIINDTRLDTRICGNPAVAAGALAYLAIPLVSASGHTLGTFCAVHDSPRAWSEHDIRVMIDLSASVMAEIELRMLSCRLLEQYNQLRTAELQRDEMMQMLVHDLRNPLTSLLAGLSLIDGMSPLPPVQKQALDIAQRGGDALLGMVNDLLEVGKHQAGQLQLERQETEPAALLAEAVDQVRHLASQAGVALTCHASDLPTCRLDADKIRRVLVNLLANAIQHTPAGGRVTLDAIRRADQQLELSVRDNGLGIPADQVDHIFNKFSSLRLKRHLGASTGLGLAFCKMVAEAHGGSLMVESTLGEGSTFRLLLPSVSNH